MTAPPLRVLVVEDDAETRAFVVALLAELGLAVDVAGRLDQARDRLAATPYDLVVLDRMLPDGSGVDLVRERRASRDGTPVLLLTALREVPERVEGLEAGADDYLGKPFAALELKARVRALLRREGRPRRVVVDGPLRLHTERREAFVDDRELPLTEREWRVLERLVTAGGRRREELLEEVWGEATPEAGASLDVIVSRLRRKLATHGLPDALETVRGYGLKWRGAR